MFGSVIYFDKRKIDEFIAIINKQKSLLFNEVEVTNDKGLNVNLKMVSADAKATKSYTATVVGSLLYDCDAFEKLLDGRDDYFDFTGSTDYDILTIGRGNIIKFNGYIKVPEEFDMTQTIEKFKPMLMKSISKDMDSNEKEAFTTFFSTADTKVPIITELNDILLCGKLETNNMLIKYEQLDEYETLEVTIIARITSSNYILSSKAFYDPLKDFMALNRAIRRGMGEDRADGMKEIFAEENYKTIEIIAIYQ
ncbi:MAG: hypothetical protein K0R00_3115 [Herbinix sp.]|nr:hypothetical protein [Anaerocolumna sp.]MDF2844689.1 hypothetical protein [Herbinix sp.]